MSCERLRRISGPIGLTTLMLLVASCLPGGGSGVGVRGVSTELVFGIPEETVDIPVTPPGFPTEPEPPSAPMVRSSPSDLGDTGPVTRQDPCPTAPITAAARVIAPSVIEELPEEGTYMWVLEGEQETDFGRFQLGGFVSRGVEGVREISDGFEFTTREPEITAGTPAIVRQTYEVLQGSDIREDGIYLTRIHRTLYDGQELSFDPQPPILFLPLPASIGTPPLGDDVEPPERVPSRPEDLPEGQDPVFGRRIDGPPQMDTTGIDPVSMASLRHAGTITEKRHIDACGELVDSYYVEGMQEYVSSQGNSYQRRFNYAVATQFGGFNVFEKADSPCGGVDENDNCQPAPTLTYELRLGQIEPEPPTDE